MKYCSKCNKNYENNIKFCPKCGTPVEEKIELKNCPSCNAENPESAKFCNECGEKFVSIIYRCSNKSCGKIYEIYDSENCFCSRCGGKIEEYKEQTFQTENNSLKEQIKDLEKKIEELNNHNNSLKKSNENQKNELENEINKLQEQLGEAKAKILSQENTISQITNEKESLQQELLKKQQEEERNKDFVLIDDFRTPFYISKYQVTQELYEKVMGKNPSYFKGAKLPVENVNWYDSIEFCNKLSEKEGLQPCYDSNHNCNFNANGYRLPTEAEWEYAAKGGENYEYSGSDKLDEVGWYENNSLKKTHEVGQKKANGYGLYDMSGNVWEWCWDLFDSSSHVLRGGSYDNYKYCAVSCREKREPSFFFSNFGFRLVRSKYEYFYGIDVPF